MKRNAVAASLSQTTPALVGLAIPVLYLMAAGPGGTASLANLGRVAATLAATLFNYLLAVAATLAAAG
ncbi:MAG: hypothetical protein HY060_07140 [Proteobacteria bacterium]|nr:hypothetical protein [Pseudomonadota bacterium]